jgi:hypothetical protein
MSDSTSDLTALAQQFADKVGRLLAACLPQAPGMEVKQAGKRVNITPEGQDGKSGGVPLLVHGETLAWLRLTYSCRMDSPQTYLAVDKSSIWVVADVDRTPIFRFDYLYDADWVPHSHIQVHGQRGALSHLLSKTGHRSPHNMGALHLPTGGQRFRPDLEDVVQFLIADCGFDSLDGWRTAVEAARADWRVIQVKAATRAMAVHAAAALEELGYSVIPPAAGHPPVGEKARFAW